MSFAGQHICDAHNSHAGDGVVGGQVSIAAHRRGAADHAATIAQVIETGRENAFAMRQRIRIRQATLAHIARVWFGYHADLPESERKKAMGSAGKLIKNISDGLPHPAGSLVRATNAAAIPWEAVERDTERALIKLSRELPAHAWVDGVHGFGELSFARIIAETGDLSGYANPGKVWKRLGLAVIDGRGQRRVRDREQAERQGYNPRRRAVVHVAFAALLRKQSSSGHEVGGAQNCHAAGVNGAGQIATEAQWALAGPYRQLYDRKKTEYAARVQAGEEGWTKLRAHRAAMRYASKRLIRDLWQAWRAAPTRSPRARKPAETLGVGGRGRNPTS